MLENHVDLTVLGTLRDVMEGEYPALLEVFINDSEKRVRELNLLTQDSGFSAASAPQLQQVGMLAHSFKGSSGNMGAAHLSELCRQLEDLARGAAAVSDVQVTHLVKAIDDEYRVVRDVYDIELQTALIRH